MFSNFKMTRKVYKIHDNGARPFRVTIDTDTKTVHVSQFVTLENSDYSIDYLYRPILMEISYIHAFVPKEKPEGNSLLFLVDTPFSKNKRYTYLSIHHYHIRTFETSDKIVHFESPVNGSDVSSPLAIGEVNYYFFLDMEYLPKNTLKHTRLKNVYDVYDAYYNYSKKTKVSHKIHNVTELCDGYKPCSLPYPY